MKVKVNNIIIPQADDYTLAITLKDGVTPVDITDYEFVGKIKSKADATTVVATFVVNKGDPTLGIATLTIPTSVSTSIEVPAQTDYVKKSAFYVYDIAMISPLDKRTTLLTGTVEVPPGVSI